VGGNLKEEKNHKLLNIVLIGFGSVQAASNSYPHFNSYVESRDRIKVILKKE
jgi:hypothetical protein